MEKQTSLSLELEIQEAVLVIYLALAVDDMGSSKEI